MTSVSLDRLQAVDPETGWKAPVKAATTANITLSGEQTIDGIACVTGDRVLVKNQTTSANNGIYEVDTSSWDRALDFDGNSEVVQGSTVYVTQGTVNGTLYFKVATADPITIGTTSLSITQALTSDSSVMTFLQAGTSAVARSVQSKLRESFSVTDFGATGNGTTNDTTTIQAAITALIAAGGGTLRFPPGVYRITSALTIDYSAAFYASNRFSRKIHLLGDGPTSTYIAPDAGAYAAMSVTGNATDDAAYFQMTGIRLAGATLTGSTGLSISKAAYGVFRDVIVEGFNVGIAATDVEQTAFYDCEIRFNTIGITGATGTVTSPNTWAFYNSLISGNYNGGAYITNANSFNYNGGSIQYNGYIGGATDYGIQFVDAGNGYGTIGFTNMIFEGNGGLGDFVAGQTLYACSVSFENVSFMRTVGFSSATVIGAANNGGGLIRLAVNSTTALTGRTKVAVWGVVGTTEANSATPWSFTIIDSTHIDLTGSAFVNAYVSGGKVTIVGFGTNNILADGSAASAVYSITNCSFKSGTGYLTLAARKSIALTNANAKIVDNGSNYFQNSTEKLTYTEAQRIGDDGTAWTSYSPAASAGGGTFTATATGKYKKVGKTVIFQAVVTTATWAATPTAPLTITLPVAAASDAIVPCMNATTAVNSTGLISSGGSTVRVWKDNAFPITANSQVFNVSGSYETST